MTDQNPLTTYKAMKKRTLPIIFAIAAAVFCSCDKNADCVPCEETKENGTLAISLLFDETTPTQAVTAYTTSQTYEKQVNRVQVFVFDEDGKVNIYKDAGTTQSNIAISTTTGKKTVWAVVNGPDLSNVASLSELEDVAMAAKITLQAYYGKKDFNKMIELSESALAAQTTDEGRSDIYYLLGVAYNEKEMFEQAIAAMKNVTAGHNVENAQAVIVALTPAE